MGFQVDRFVKVLILTMNSKSISSNVLVYNHCAIGLLIIGNISSSKSFKILSQHKILNAVVL